MSDSFAAIDIGSYEVVLAIYEITAGRIKNLDQVRHVIPLGRDNYKKGSISDSLVEELCDVLEDFNRIMRSYDVKSYRMCATSALRDAKNKRNVIDRIKVKTGLVTDVLSNSEQRFLVYKAVASKEMEFDNYVQKGMVMVDAGSGNTQISLFDNGSLITTQHLELGALRINESISELAKTTQSYVDVMEEVIDTDIDALKHLFIKERKYKCLLALGDNINLLNKRINVNSKNQKFFYTTEEFQNMYDRLFINREYISREYDMSEEQADLILPSAMIYKKLLEATEAKTVWIPDADLCDGMAAEYAESIKKFNFSHDFNADIVAAAKNISKRYSWNKDHIRFVEKNALMIFDCLKKTHGLGKRERLLLQISCILHDCGQYISMLHPEECSYNIIMSTEIIGLSHLEREIVANIVKYTTVEFDYDNRLDKLFDESVYLVISKLTAFIKLANMLDKGHKQKFGEVKYKLFENELHIITETGANLIIEKNKIKDKSLIKQVLGIRPVIVQKIVQKKR